MAKINFTQEHFSRLQELALLMLFNNSTVNTPMGQSLGVTELLHTTNINSLNAIRTALTKKIETKEAADEWGATDREQQELDTLKAHKEFVNLIVGWKRKNAEIAEAQKTRRDLEAKLKTLKDSQKTPADLIKEVEEQLASLKEEF